MHWSLAIAKEIVKRGREKEKQGEERGGEKRGEKRGERGGEKRGEKTQVVATGITPSGEIHVGNLREIITGAAVHSALVDLGAEARLIYIADTFDPLRRRYSFLPEEYEVEVGRPLSEIPDPRGCHSSYAEHFLQPFLESLEELGIKVEVFRADEMYKSGQYAEAIKEAVARRAELSRILEEVSGRRLPEGEGWSPFNPLCDACGRITTAVVKESSLDLESLEREEVRYECECGNEGVASFKGGGKLAWRVDWAARWKILGVTVEPFGKDHAAPGGSFETGKRISAEIFNYEPPFPVPFEHILLKTKREGEGAKAKVTAMSSSRGTNVPVHEVLETVPPEVLKHLILRTRPEKHIEFDPGLPLLNLIDEYEREKGGIGKGTAGKIPFRHLLTLVQIARGDFSELLEVVKRSGYEVRVESEEESEEERKEIKKKAGYAENWLRKYAPPSLKFELQSALPSEEVKNLSEGQKRALGQLAGQIKGRGKGEEGRNLSAAEWQDKIYEVAAATETEAKEIFKAVYLALLGKPSGPRAGWLLASLDAEFLRGRFEAVRECEANPKELPGREPR